MIDKYEKIIAIICEYKGIKEEEIVNLLDDNDCRYLLFLLLKKYNCINVERLKEDFSITNKSSINYDYDYKKAREKFFVNKNFRDAYFEIDNLVNKIII